MEDTRRVIIVCVNAVCVVYLFVVVPVEASWHECRDDGIEHGGQHEHHPHMRRTHTQTTLRPQAHTTQEQHNTHQITHHTLREIEHATLFLPVSMSLSMCISLCQCMCVYLVWCDVLLPVGVVR